MKYLFVSVPALGNKQNTFLNIRSKLGEYANTFVFNVPEFKARWQEIENPISIRSVYWINDAYRLAHWMHWSCYQTRLRNTTRLLNSLSISWVISWPTWSRATRRMVTSENTCWWTTVKFLLLLYLDLVDWNWLTCTNIEPVEEYISTFQWNSMKYRTDKSLQETTAMLNQVKKDEVYYI